MKSDFLSKKLNLELNLDKYLVPGTGSREYRRKFNETTRCTCSNVVTVPSCVKEHVQSARKTYKLGNVSEKGISPKFSPLVLPGILNLVVV